MADALPNNVIRWTISGSYHGEETWNFDWWTAPTTAPTSAADFQDTLNQLKAALDANTFPATLATLMCTGGDNVGALKGLAYTTGQTAEYVAVANWTGINGTSNSFGTLQQAFVVTTLTDHPTRSTRGRMYLPADGVQLDATHRVPLASVSGVVTKLATALSTGNFNPKIGPPVVVSRKYTKTTRIVNLRYDLRLDIQRRRANKQGTGVQTTVAIPT